MTGLPSRRTSVTTATAEQVILEKSIYALAIGEAIETVFSLMSTIRMRKPLCLERGRHGLAAGDGIGSAAEVTGAGGLVLQRVLYGLYDRKAGLFVAEVIEASSLANRIDIMMQRSVATLALPGSIGTAAELLISWNTNHIMRRAGTRPRVSVAVGPSWKALARALVDAGAFEGDVYWVETVDEGVDRIISESSD